MRGLRVLVLAAALVALAGFAGAAPTAAEARPPSFEKRVLNHLNALRARQGLPRLRVVPGLRRAARVHAADMRRKDYFSHRSQPSGMGFARRVRRFYRSSRGLGETIAWSTWRGPVGTPRAIVRAWMRSAPHRRIILRRRYVRVGLGAARGRYQGTPDAVVVVADFATVPLR